MESKEMPTQAHWCHCPPSIRRRDIPQSLQSGSRSVPRPATGRVLFAVRYPSTRCSCGVTRRCRVCLACATTLDVFALRRALVRRRRSPVIYGRRVRVFPCRMSVCAGLAVARTASPDRRASSKVVSSGASRQPPSCSPCHAREGAAPGCDSGTLSAFTRRRLQFNNRT